MFEMGEETMNLPIEEKMKFEQGDNGVSFGYISSLMSFAMSVVLMVVQYNRYKAAGVNATDEYGNLDTVEFINVAKDDALSFPAMTHRTYPSTVNAHMKSTIRPFVLKALEVNFTFLSVFEKKLGLPAGALLNRHKLASPSGSEARCIRNPPKQASEAVEKGSTAIGAHTDFGSLSFLHNRLGGLQVLPPGYETWQYVRPIPGHAICNVGDALTLFSGGILRSNLHRVIPPPGLQASHPRWSLVFFIRPGSDVKLHALTEDSAIIRDAVNAVSEAERKKYDPDVTAGEWFARRIKNQRIKNRTVRTNYFPCNVTCPCQLVFRVLRLGVQAVGWSINPKPFKVHALVKPLHISSRRHLNSLGSELTKHEMLSFQEKSFMLFYTMYIIIFAMKLNLPTL